ncbi:NUDIX domain-containing protein [Xanthomarina sp. F1114]|uniref:NUDIX hydrolase n=1 Tax=Xanthomarina sp. F1114 TaxID=2996019 RepID=UPI00225E1B1A|nr:NUDIX domain-containing protein [Xanthomarina sp. F1114]MCX7548650.1 NUDIX domain-containing protein [Xanthomarina sp. F1114]
MDELIDILTKEGKPSGKTALKSEVHRKGLYHNTAHIWFYTHDGQILLAQRAASKSICPLLWDVSVAGHVDAGETIEEAAIRETQEEIGLIIKENDLFKIGVFPCFQSYENGIVDNEFHHTYLVELKVSLEKLKPQPGEVEALELVTVKSFKSLLANSESNAYFVASNRDYYEMVLEGLIEKLSYE